MKIIDKTPLLDEQGNLGLVQRIQGMLQYGFNWSRELEVQKAIIKYFDRQLEKGYTLIRNLTLGQSGIMIPMILLGPSGIFVIEVTHLRGRYEARGENWNVESGDAYKPAPVNLIQRTLRMANALQKFIERQGVKLQVGIEPVIIAGDPGLHIESVRPAVKVMMIDGIKAFVSGLVSGRPVMSNEMVHDYTDRILNPRPKQDMSVPPPGPDPEPEPRAAWEDMYGWNENGQQQAPAQDVPSFDPGADGFDFALAEQEAHAEIRHEPNPVQSARPAKAKPRLILGMTPLQLAVIGGLALALFCILAVFAYIVFL